MTVLSSSFNLAQTVSAKVLNEASSDAYDNKHQSKALDSATGGIPAADDQVALIWQAAEQDIPFSTLYDQQLDNGIGGKNLGNDTYIGIKHFWDNEIISNLFPNIGQLFGKWLSEWLNGWAVDTIGLLTAMLRTFFLNPNIALHDLNTENYSSQPQNNDDISPLIHQAAGIMYAIALDLLLLLFILAIWRYWTEAAWRGGMGVMGAVARLIFTSGIILAWPTICALEIEVSNQMIKAIFFGAFDQVQMIDATLASTVKAGLVAAAYLVAKSLVPSFGNWTSSYVGSTIVGAVSTVALMIFLILAVVLILQLIIILIMKAVQTVLLTAQYMFAPVFLVFFAIPDTESVASGFIKSCVEVSLWTFAWVGLLKIMLILLFSAVSPWGKILMAIAILQIMIQIPSFLARASISPISPFAASGLISTSLKSNAFNLGTTLFEKSLSLASVLTQNESAGLLRLPAKIPNQERRTWEELRPPSFNTSANESQTSPRSAYTITAQKRLNKASAAITDAGSPIPHKRILRTYGLAMAQEPPLVSKPSSETLIGRSSDLIKQPLLHERQNEVIQFEHSNSDKPIRSPDIMADKAGGITSLGKTISDKSTGLEGSNLPQEDSMLPIEQSLSEARRAVSNEASEKILANRVNNVSKYFLSLKHPKPPLEQEINLALATDHISGLSNRSLIGRGKFIDRPDPEVSLEEPGSQSETDEHLSNPAFKIENQSYLVAPFKKELTAIGKESLSDCLLLDPMASQLAAQFEDRSVSGTKQTHDSLAINQPAAEPSKNKNDEQSLRQEVNSSSQNLKANNGMAIATNENTTAPPNTLDDSATLPVTNFSRSTNKSQVPNLMHASPNKGKLNETLLSLIKEANNKASNQAIEKSTSNFKLVRKNFSGLPEVKQRAGMINISSAANSAKKHTRQLPEHKQCAKEREITLAIKPGGSNEKQPAELFAKPFRGFEYPHSEPS